MARKSKLFWALERARSFKASERMGNELTDTERDLVVLAGAVKSGGRLAAIKPVLVCDAVVPADCVNREDSGMAIIAHVPSPDVPGRTAFVRLHSWADDGKHEAWMAGIAGKRVRVIVEVCDA